MGERVRERERGKVKIVSTLGNEVASCSESEMEREREREREREQDVAQWVRLGSVSWVY